MFKRIWSNWKMNNKSNEFEKNEFFMKISIFKICYKVIFIFFNKYFIKKLKNYIIFLFIENKKNENMKKNKIIFKINDFFVIKNIKFY